MPELDAHDLKILAALQEDGRLTVNELADRVGLSASPCWRRMKRLEAEGVIRGYQAVLEPRRLGMGVTVFVTVSIERQSADSNAEFEARVRDIPEVVACHMIAGQYDFLLHVVTRDLDAYADLSINVIARIPGVRQILSSFSLKEIKPFRHVPLETEVSTPSRAPARKRKR